MIPNSKLGVLSKIHPLRLESLPIITLVYLPYKSLNLTRRPICLAR